MLKKLIEKEISQEEWCMTSGKDSHQTCKRIFGKKIKLFVLRDDRVAQTCRASDTQLLTNGEVSPSEGYSFKSYPSHTSFTS